MKILVAYSGGKDSQASLIWAKNEFGVKNIEAVFCDTGWEHDFTYKHITDTCEELGVKLVVLKSKQYDGMLDMAKQKGRFPSTMARFCTEELKVKPMIDYILDEVKNNVLILQGIRADESTARSKMESQCRFFKYYFTPYGYDKDGKPKYHKYRKKEVKTFCAKYMDDVLRPIFTWTAAETINYILDNRQKPNPLYYKGAGRVGCFPCIMTNKAEIHSMLENTPEFYQRVKEAEASAESTFFPPDYIPPRYCSKSVITKDGDTVKVPTIDDVVRYVTDKTAQMEIFQEQQTDGRCMSFYSICE
jgi:3'-phosphoadenosine 5'-phosphosulfate sulfotransferase (PAPS reductase)/FAD synthetase